MYYVYRYLDENNTIIYVGITDRPLQQRRSEHKYNEWYNDSLIYEFIQLPNRFIAKVYETYLISTYKPIGNKAEKNVDVSLISFNFSPVWQNFNQYEVRTSKKTKVITNKYKKQLQYTEERKRCEEILYNILHKYQDKIIDRYYDKHKRLVIKFDSKDVKDLMSQMNRIPRVIDCINENTIEIIFINNSKDIDPTINEKYNEIFTLLEIDKFNLDINEGVRKLENKKKLNKLRCECKIKENSSFTFIKHTHEEKKITINDFIRMNNGLSYCIIDGVYRKFIYNNDEEFIVYYDTIDDIMVSVEDNNEWCVKERDFFYIMECKLFVEEIKTEDPDGDLYVKKPNESWLEYL